MLGDELLELGSPSINATGGVFFTLRRSFLTVFGFRVVIGRFLRCLRFINSSWNVKCAWERKRKEKPQE